MGASGVSLDGRVASYSTTLASPKGGHEPQLPGDVLHPGQGDPTVAFLPLQHQLHGLLLGQAGGGLTALQIGASSLET